MRWYNHQDPVVVIRKTVTDPVRANKSIMEFMLCAAIPVPNEASGWGGVARGKKMGMLSRVLLQRFRVAEITLQDHELD